MPRTERREPRTVRLPVEVWQQIEAQAQAERRSVNNLIEVALLVYLRDPRPLRAD